MPDASPRNQAREPRPDRYCLRRDPGLGALAKVEVRRKGRCGKSFPAFNICKCAVLSSLERMTARRWASKLQGSAARTASATAAPCDCEAVFGFGTSGEAPSVWLAVRFAAVQAERAFALGSQRWPSPSRCDPRRRRKSFPRCGISPSTRSRKWCRCPRCGSVRGRHREPTCGQVVARIEQPGIARPAIIASPGRRCSDLADEIT
jgi:hypothetical protein